MDGIRNDKHLSAKVRTGIQPIWKRRNANIPFFVTGVVLILVVIGYEFMTRTPEGTRNTAVQLGPIEMDASHACATYIRKTLKDPKAEFVEGAFVTTKGGIWKVRCRTRSKKTLFPTLGNLYECTMNRDARGKWTLLAISKVL